LIAETLDKLSQINLINHKEQNLCNKTKLDAQGVKNSELSINA